MTKIYDEYKNNAYPSMLSSTMEIHYYCENNLKEEKDHVHDCFEIYCVIDGTSQFEIEEHEYLLSKGDLILVPPMISHSAIIKSKTYEWAVLWLNPWYLSRMSSQKTNLTSCFASAEQLGYRFTADPFIRNRIISIMQELYTESKKQRYGSDILINADVQKILILLHRYMHLDITENKSTMEQVLQYVNQHYSEVITLDFLCEKFYISKFYLSRSFEELTGKSIYQYILEKRMVMARQLLVCGEKPSDVCTICGFNQYSNFYRAFKKYYKMSPREFIKEEL